MPIIDINSTAPDFRDFLLKKNLVIPEYLKVTPAGVSSPQVGGQATVDDNINTVLLQPDIKVDGIFYKDIIEGSNKYGSNTEQNLLSIDTLLSPNNQGDSGEYYKAGIADYTSPAIYNITQSQEIIDTNLSRNEYNSTNPQEVANIVTTPNNQGNTGEYYKGGIADYTLPPLNNIDESKVVIDKNLSKNEYNSSNGQEVADIVTTLSPNNQGNTGEYYKGGIADYTSPVIFNLGESQDIINKNLIINAYKSSNEQETVNIELNPTLNVKGTFGDYYKGAGVADYTSPSIDNISQSSNIIYGNLSKNVYNGAQEQVLANITTNEQTVKPIKSYIDANGSLTVGGPSILPVDILGSLLNGQGIGVGDNGVVTDFDLRASLAGRVLGGTGIIADTPIGQAGAKYLGLAFLNNVSFNLQKETIGLINTSPLSLLKGGDIILPNYDITVPVNSLIKKVDYFGKLLGVGTPVSLLQTTSSIFDSENPIGNIQRANSMISNTGRGQIAALFFNLRANKSSTGSTGTIQRYQPAFTDTRKNDGLNPNLYAFDDGKGFVIDLLNNVNSNPVSQSNYKKLNKDFDSLEVLNETSKSGEQDTFIWNESIFEDVQMFKQPKSILYKTQELFNSGKMQTILSNLEGNGGTEDIQTTNKNGKISKGSAVLGSNNEFCRAWSTSKRYDKINDLQKHSGIDPKGGLRLTQTNSVLQDTGFVKIAPEIDSNGDVEVKNFMFSIENLAWSDNIQDLIECEIGPGDLISETKGRIMWFPPYDLSFTDNTSVNWDSTNFIGRGEPIYTYNNTERSGTLQFKVVVDHPSVFNTLRLSSDKNLIDSVVSGCIPIPSRIKSVLSQNEINAIEVKNAQQKQVVKDTPINQESFSIFFPNDYSGDLSVFLDGVIKYENGAPFGEYLNDGGETKIDTENFGLNTSVLADLNGGVTSKIGKYMTENPSTVIEIKGYASVRPNAAANDGPTAYNINLAINRAENAKLYLIKKLGISADRFKSVNGNGETGSLINNVKGEDSKTEKEARKVDISIKADPNKNELLNQAEPKILTAAEKEKSIEVQSRLYKECDYFYKLEQDNPFIFNHIKEKLKFFSPGFHSTTPEGLNSRLNFLMQCTRQGPTNKAATVDNLSFGRPPVCILRIGDFYHTKIVMDSVSFSFDPLVWDLNPEGIGVQPMIVSVDISFKFIGGSSLAGPINRLQNAVSFNYFANTEIYDTRADRIKVGGLERGHAPGIPPRLSKRPVSTPLSNNTPVETDQKTVVDRGSYVKNISSTPTNTTTTKANIIIANTTSYSSDNEEVTIILGTELSNDIDSDSTGNITLSNMSTPDNTPISLGIITMSKDTNSKTQVYPISLTSGLYHLAIDFGNGIIKRSKLNVI